jgi:hypothetical protein
MTETINVCNSIYQPESIYGKGYIKVWCGFSLWERFLLLFVKARYSDGMKYKLLNRCCYVLRDNIINYG